MIYKEAQYDNDQKGIIKEKYISVIIHNDGTQLKRIASNDPDAILSRSTVILENEYPDAVCKIIDLKSNKKVCEIKKRHCLE